METTKFQVVEIPVNTAGTKFFFPDQPQLRYAKIQKIELYTIAFITASPLTYGTMAAIADMQKCFLTLYREDVQIVQNRPILAYNPFVASTNPYTNQLDGIADQSISWTKSFILFSAAPAGTSVVPFGIHYIDDPNGPRS
jgi:hypothetical protein